MTTKTRPKVLFFDVNETLLDLTIMKKQVGDALGGNQELLSLWFTTMLQYSLVVSASGRYQPFGHIGAAALQMVAANQDITIPEDKARDIIVNAMQNLPPHPEVKEALKALKNDGYTLVALTNSNAESLKNKFENVGLTTYFDKLLSIESVGKFKPFTDVYNWAAKNMNVKPEDCMLIAAHGWDVAGALWAGWRAAFVSRPGQQTFPLAPKTEINESDLQKVAAILVSYK
ncbi:haloacid dehalogenase type II [Psychroserpens sp. NJDZ02]|uniref:haloacid dehalogenase type II n=1 Tax=Psychroserpens sp. NJDZ02 TaxID=2570561 RepID=UPI0010A8A8B5|nr:haloacid dehalogenase type II [Psychroserpens sp. NJDZ02]QCE42558.1 haloacid dehalogenase type II [Psychroserpens sp. NJDZ02]